MPIELTCIICNTKFFVRPSRIISYRWKHILNNSFENIEVLKNQSEHIKIHLPEMLKKRKQKHGY